MTFDLNKAMDDAFAMGNKLTLIELRDAEKIISFIDSCGFDSEQLQCIVRAVDDMKGSDYESSDNLGEDLTESLREQRGEFNKA